MQFIWSKNVLIEFVLYFASPSSGFWSDPVSVFSFAHLPATTVEAAALPFLLRKLLNREPGQAMADCCRQGAPSHPLKQLMFNFSA